MGKRALSPFFKPWLFANNLDEDAFVSAAVELGVEDLFPRAEVEFAFGDGDDNFAAENLAFEMGVAVVFAGIVMAVFFDIVGSYLFEEFIKILDQAALVVIDVDAGGDVHRIDQYQTFLDTRFFDDFFDLRRDVDVFAACFGVKGDYLAKRSHLREKKGTAPFFNDLKIRKKGAVPFFLRELFKMDTFFRYIHFQ